MIFYYNSYLAILIAGAASGIHVTRQSVGVTRLTGVTKQSLSEVLIYFGSFFSIFIGFLRFYYLDGYFKDEIYYLIGIFLIISLVISIGIFYRHASINQISSILCGSILMLLIFL